jgi:hypothetical protein
MVRKSGFLSPKFGDFLVRIVAFWGQKLATAVLKSGFFRRDPGEVWEFFWRCDSILIPLPVDENQPSVKSRDSLRLYFMSLSPVRAIFQISCSFSGKSFLVNTWWPLSKKWLFQAQTPGTSGFLRPELRNFPDHPLQKLPGAWNAAGYCNLSSFGW